MLTPSGKIVVAAAAAFLVAGGAAHYPELVAVGTACLLALVTGLWYVRLRPELVASRTVAPPRVTEGEPARAPDPHERGRPPQSAHARGRDDRRRQPPWPPTCCSCSCGPVAWRRPGSNGPEMSTATRRSLSNEARLRPPRLAPVTVGVPDDVWDRWRSADPSSWRWPSPGPSSPGSCRW
jgi:hypothetical protein